MKSIHPEIEWDQGQPVSKSFGDVYFSKANGLEETRHVFLHHNQLTDRWQQFSDNDIFIIGETGFGSGLNFLAAWDLWLKTTPSSAQLHIVSVEKFPLHKNDLQKALALWPELEFLATQLIEVYPCFVGRAEDPTLALPSTTAPSVATGETGRGSSFSHGSFHRLSFMQGRVKLTLIIDDAVEGLKKLLASTHPLFIRAGFKMDAWFLDGFSPAKNPQMWSDELFSVIANLSHLHTTVATFSAAALVKNGLKNVGFSVEKVEGFGRKREMVKASFVTEPPTLDASQFEYKGSFSPYPIPWTISDTTISPQEKTVTIIGGGITGCHTARALAERGWQVTLIERHQDLAQEASGNPQGAVYAKLSVLDEAQAAFNLHALQFALHYYANLWPEIGQQSGLLQLTYDDTESKLHQDLFGRFAQSEELVQFVTAAQASQIAGIDVQFGGLYFPKAGWINPKKLCKLLINHSNIHIKYNSQAIELNRINGHWKIRVNQGLDIESRIVVLANNRDAANFELTNHLPFNSIRGQITYLPQVADMQLNTVICADGYISPAEEGQFCIGATFNLRDTNPNPRTEDHQINLANLKKYLPSLTHYWQEINVNDLKGRVAFRCSLPDYLPAVGQAPMKEQMQKTFAPLSVNARAGITQPGSYHPGLYLNLAQGSRGLTYTPLCAELLASIINKEPLPISQSLANALNPARFLIRGIVKRKK